MFLLGQHGKSEMAVQLAREKWRRKLFGTKVVAAASIVATASFFGCPATAHFQTRKWRRKLFGSKVVFLVSTGGMARTVRKRE